MFVTIKAVHSFDNHIMYFMIQVIHLKHVLQLVEPLQNAIEESDNYLLKAFYQVRKLCT